MKIPCPQCGGDVPLRDTSGLVRCPFCHSSLVLDFGGVRPHVIVQPRRAPGEVVPLLRDWCQTLALPLPASLGVPRLIYRPYWQFSGPGQPRMVPAWPTIDPRWAAVPPPEGARGVFDPAAVAQDTIIEASVPEAAVRGEGGPGDLVHVPYYDLQGSWDGTRQWFSVDACAGTVYPERLPVGARRDTRRAAIVTAASVGFACMFLESALVPSAWAAATAVAATAGAVYWAMRGGCA